MILFETTESVFEVLWDIALAIFILRIGFAYFFVAFTTGTVSVAVRRAASASEAGS